ncbi:Regulator of rDNA transcription protein 15 [Capsicum baccatum]|uniref:Regulator of rDNA transcription protein 15 n=1 Tax=Capsicum baccatum TaxID=33114 RepID=A0A2G2V3Z0_CAPBA|nr:Regulator of rDNA transcription protein 15 [Capsicum baccatum]
MIGRADIEGSKSNVAMNAWLPQASYPCGNFFDTSTFEFQRSKGSLGHAFTVHICTGSLNQTSFYPSVPHEISVLFELILGHLHYLLIDVPPQPNSPPDNVFRPDRPADRIPLVRTSSELAVRRAGKAPEGTVPSPSPGRHAATRSRRGSSSSSPPTADGFGTGTPVPSPQSQSFSRSYGSILPTSLAYIVPSTRGCSPWRPDAVMSTTGRGRHSVLRIFKGRRERTGHHATCGALPAAGPYLRLSRFQGGQAVKQKRQLFPRLPLMSQDFLTLSSTATSRFRNFNPIPFWSTHEMRSLSGFPRPLGLTNPCASVVHMEPFPSSAFKVLI